MLSNSIPKYSLSKFLFRKENPFLNFLILSVKNVKTIYVIIVKPTIITLLLIPNNRFINTHVTVDIKSKILFIVNDIVVIVITYPIIFCVIHDIIKDSKNIKVNKLYR